ncbi:Peptidase M20 domain-containing protein [Beauveria bassiana]|uniref:Peptidase family protein n=1 Tax=Beauveria bassiana (strain ARSEF 2860) TaxID=655819 RepID=J4WDL8_BEAB2|nr:peptidase family protein [Beauveria bassiana ARSEF 2860]EJP68120.1 peptidase family protein [Beauveria bassiana ARSEF 2860]KAH8713739.1 Peptidase M20 domain-containing protein [Beauveria bassiana]
MHLLSIAAALAALPAAFCLHEQAPLNSHSKLHGAAAADKHAPSYRKALLDLHRNLVSIPSISGAEHDVGQWLVNYLVSKDFRTDVQLVAPREGTPKGAQRFNVLAWPGKHEKSRPRVLVSSHIDVVPPYIAYGIDDGPVTKDTVIRGRGSVDAKAAVAAMTIAVEELVAAGRVKDDDVMLVFVVGEEVAGDGMITFSDAALARDEPPSWHSVIFGEPTESKLVCGHKGALFCELKVTGRASHSGYPWLGKSANELLIHAVSKILETDLGSSELYGNTTFNLGLMEGGVAANVVPASATGKFGARVAIGPEKDGHLIVKKRIQDILDQVDKDAFEMTCSPGYGTVDCNCDVEGFETLTVNYGTDVANLKGNFTRYLYGPGSILVAHGENEALTVGDLELAVENYGKLIEHALSKKV